MESIRAEILKLKGKKIGIGSCDASLNIVCSSVNPSYQYALECTILEVGTDCFLIESKHDGKKIVYAISFVKQIVF